MKSLLIGLVLISISCSPKEIAGRYELRHFPKTSIEIRGDKTFQFIQMYPNPYLHPFDHPDENYFVTEGKWMQSSKLILNSTQDSVATKIPEVIAVLELTSPPDTTTTIDQKREINIFSRFVFHDIYNDTVNVLYAQSPDGTTMTLLHRSMKFVDWPLHGSDTIEFHFFGYPPYKYVRPNKKRQQIDIRLYPKFRSSVFDSTVLIIRRNKLIIGKACFERKPSRPSQKKIGP